MRCPPVTGLKPVRPTFAPSPAKRENERDMKMNRNPGGRAMNQSQPGGLVLPPAAAAQRAKEAAEQFDKHLLAWCPVIGAHELADGTECVWGKLPLPPHQPVLYYPCPTCKQMHMVAMVLVPKPDEQETADALGASLRTVQRDWMRAKAWLREEMGDEPPVVLELLAL